MALLSTTVVVAATFVLAPASSAAAAGNVGKSCAGTTDSNLTWDRRTAVYGPTSGANSGKPMVVYLYGRKIELRTGRVGPFPGTHVYWARITDGNPGDGTRLPYVGDRIWYDWQNQHTAWNEWYQCGPVTVTSTGSNAFTPAFGGLGSIRSVRVCGDVRYPPPGGQQYVCSGWSSYPPG